LASDTGKTKEIWPLEAVVLRTANSRSYLSSVFKAYRENRVVLTLPRTSEIKAVPGVKITDRQTYEDEPGWFDESYGLVRSVAPAQIALSSGTTGRPKPLLLSHLALSDVVERINSAMEVDSTISEYVGIPIMYSFGFGRCRAVAAAGGRSFLPAHGFDPIEIARMLKTGEVNAISAVPTLWRMILANPEVLGGAGKHVKWIEIGSQYMGSSEKHEMKRLFPHAKIVQHYGLTEASRTTLLDVSATEGPGLESVGKAMGKVEIAIGEGGAIRIRGPHVAEGLVTGAGLKSIKDADGWHTTADRGRIENGLLYYEGRSDELINCGGIKVDPTQFEQRLEEKLGFSGVVSVGGVKDALRGECVLVAIRHGAGIAQKAIETAATEICNDLGLAGGGALVFRQVDHFPKTATGKVRRKLLAELPDRTVQAAWSAVQLNSAPSATRATELQILWAEVLGIPAVSLTESFYDHGGDSLSALTAIMHMEALGFDAKAIQGIFEGKTIAEITGMDESSCFTAQTAET
jgi:acyl-CoA synthetase (AMP-forming)/AMP-acid ligase II